MAQGGWLAFQKDSFGTKKSKVNKGAEKRRIKIRPIARCGEQEVYGEAKIF